MAIRPLGMNQDEIKVTLITPWAWVAEAGIMITPLRFIGTPGTDTTRAVGLAEMCSTPPCGLG
jgi:hypothetical protein